jgi:hypothetical protein
VYVFWHAPIPGKKGEQWRRVWMTRSLNDGKTFEGERVAWDHPTGACGCCSLDAGTDASGKVYVLFRSAQEMVHRDMYLLESADQGASFLGSNISQWNVGYCVMSSEAFASGPDGTVAAWETGKQIHFGKVNAQKATADDAVVSATGADQKYPALAFDRAGALLVSWTEGMKWKRGGSVHWQLFDRAGRRVDVAGSREGVPAWSLVATYPERNGNFVVLY